MDRILTRNRVDVARLNREEQGRSVQSDASLRQIARRLFARLAIADGRARTTCSKSESSDVPREIQNGRPTQDWADPDCARCGEAAGEDARRQQTRCRRDR